MKRLLTIAAVVLWAGVACAQSNFKYNGLSYTSTGVTFANLGVTPPQTNGSLVYCSDCTNALPCAGGGNGAWAQRLNGSWNCLAGATGTVAANALINGQAGATLNGRIDPTAPPYNAVCDGTTDDHVALQTALTASAGGTFRFPANKTCSTGATGLTYNTATLGPIDIEGGENSVLKYTGTGNALTISGAPGITRSNTRLANFQIAQSGANTATDLLQLNGITDFWVSNLVLNGNNKATNCYHLIAAQQGHITGGAVGPCTVNAQMDAALFNNVGPGYVHSNGVEWDGITFIGGTATTAAGIKIGSEASPCAAVDDSSIHSNHITGIAGVPETMFDLQSCFGDVNLYDNHIEPFCSTGASCVSLIIRNGRVNAINNSFYGTPGAGGQLDIDVLSGSVNSIIAGNLIDGNAKIETGAGGTKVLDNTFGGTSVYTDNGTVTIFGPSQYFVGGEPSDTASNYIGGTFTWQRTSKALAAGNLALFKPEVGGPGGAWGIGVDGSGANQPVYVQLHDVALEGNTGGGNLKFVSTVGGTLWGTLSANGLFSAFGVGTTPATLATFPVCAAGTEGLSATQTNSTAACSAGTVATSAGTTHCQIYCNGSQWVQTGR